VTSGLTVLGNLAVDRVDHGDRTPGGCPSFIGPALSTAPGHCRVVTRAASGDVSLFAGHLAAYPVPVTLLEARHTNGFQLLYDGEDRRVVVDDVGDPWTIGDIDAASIDTEWVHVAPLLREEFPVETLRYLVDLGHRISFDGQGLVREAAVGLLCEDDMYDRGILQTLSVLKLAEEEAAIVLGGAPGIGNTSALGVPEVVVTLGSRGCEIYTGGAVDRVTAARPVLGVHTTGAGEVFAVGYAACRAAGAEPAAAAEWASGEVATMLELRY